MHVLCFLKNIFKKGPSSTQKYWWSSYKVVLIKYKTKKKPMEWLWEKNIKPFD